MKWNKPRTKAYAVMLSPELYADVRKMAEANGCNPSQMAMTLIRAGWPALENKFHINP